MRPNSQPTGVLQHISVSHMGVLQQGLPRGEPTGAYGNEVMIYALDSASAVPLV